MNLHRGADPLASPTLAALYLRQGHLERARQVTQQLLQRTPDDPTAHALARRVEWLRRVDLEAWVRDEHLHLRMPGAPAHAVVLEVKVFSVDGLPPATIERTWTPDAGPRTQVPLPSERGAAVARIRISREGILAILGVSRVVTW